MTGVCEGWGGGQITCVRVYSYSGLFKNVQNSRFTDVLKTQSVFGKGAAERVALEFQVKAFPCLASPFTWFSNFTSHLTWGWESFESRSPSALRTRNAMMMGT